MKKNAIIPVSKISSDLQKKNLRTWVCIIVVFMYVCESVCIYLQEQCSLCAMYNASESVKSASVP